MIETILLQKSVNKTIKEGLPKLQEVLDSLIESRWTTSTVYRLLKDEKNIRLKAIDAISPRIQMTRGREMNTKKLKGRIKKRTRLGCHSFASQTRTPVVCTTSERKGERKQRAKNPRYDIKYTNYGEERWYQQTPPTARRSRTGQTSRRLNLRGRIAEDQGYPSTIQTLFKTIRCTQGG